MLKIYNYEEREEVLSRLEERLNVADKGDKAQAVAQIIREISHRGDSALFEYCKKFDGNTVDKKSIIVSKKEIKSAYEKVSGELKKILKEAYDNIYSYHMLQKRSNIALQKEGVRLELLIRPIERVGVYVPGGKAAYPSSVLMNIIPAKVAGVSEIYMATPANEKGEINSLTLVAADIAGADAIYKMGGAQAIAAFAVGTQTIKKVDKVTGPGNVYVNIAKRLLYGITGIDMIAGPSEIMIAADKNANPDFIAADFLSQAEHDELAACLLVTDSKDIAQKSREKIEEQLSKLSKQNIIKESLNNFGAIILTENIEQTLDIINAVAPEHLEIMTDNPYEYLNGVKNAGCVFIGAYSPEPLGDYFAGTNHILPTNGSARFASPLNVDDFMKKMSVVEYSKEAFYTDYKKIVRLALAEGLEAHAKSAQIRFKEE